MTSHAWSSTNQILGKDDSRRREQLTKYSGKQFKIFLLFLLLFNGCFFQEMG
jgi:hypothetical protein